MALSVQAIHREDRAMATDIISVTGSVTEDERAGVRGITG
jgi:hypothetical protein